jgi:hypothetical protein
MDLSSVVPSQQGKEKIIVNGYLMVKDKNQWYIFIEIVKKSIA